LIQIKATVPRPPQFVCIERRNAMQASWFVMAPMVGVAILFALGMVSLTGRAERSVRRAQSLRARALHEEIF
jgi:hypothetical protein